MPTFSPHYKLAMFGFGDVYNASLDRQRFTIIDNQLWFIGSMIGDGVLSGWNVTSDGNSITVSGGTGIIDGFSTVTYGTQAFTVANNNQYFVYMLRQPNIVASVSAFSAINSIIYTDVTAPANPTGLIGSALYNAVSLSWNRNVEKDIGNYSIYRSSDGTSFTLLGTSTSNTFNDNSVSQLSNYWYKIKATDVNNLTSNFSNVVHITTPLDPRLPSDPTNVVAVNGNEIIEVVWDASLFLCDHYLVTLQPVDTEGVNNGIAIQTTTTDLFVFFTDLDNGQNYTITVQSVSLSGILSNPVIINGQPTFSYGAAEFSHFVISESLVDSSFNIDISLSWDLDTDEYNASPAYYFITVSQPGEDAQSSYYKPTGNHADISSYTLTDGTQKNIQENTNYVIQIQSVSVDSIQSVPYIIRHKTHKYSPPDPVTLLNIDAQYTQNSRSVTATWTNPLTNFSNVNITVIKKPIATQSDASTWTTIANNISVGRASSYAIPFLLIDNECLYTFSLHTVDFAGNISSIASLTVPLAVSFSNTFIAGGITLQGVRPPVPTNMNAASGNGQVTIYWNKAESDYIQSYKVWRAQILPTGPLASDFQSIVTVDMNTYKFNDYDVTNGQQYYYFVTCVDIFGQESPNPSDGFISYPYVVGEPRSHTDLTDPPAVNVIIDPYDSSSVLLSWTSETGNFDGYQIFRATNSLDFVNVGSALPSDTQFIDTNALLHSGTYHYMIRKFRNDGIPFISTNEVAPVDGIPLASVLIVSGVATVTSLIFDIKLLIDPIKIEATKQLSSPTHIYNSVGDDRRIRLADELVVSDWTTTDFQTYTTNSDIRSTSSFIAYIDGVQSAFNAHVDTTLNTITFDSPIFVPAAITDTGPSVSVVFTNTAEVTGILPQNNIGLILGNKLNRGKLNHEQIPSIDHFGRYHEIGNPLKKSTVSNGTFLYNSQTLINGITFYDVIVLPSGQVLAGASDGVRLSLSSDASQWTTVFPSLFPCTKVLYSSFYNMYFAVTGKNVNYSVDLSVWKPIDGLSGVNIIRDFVDDGKGNLYISTDSGVYKLNIAAYTKLIWQQTATIDIKNNSAFALLVETNDIVVSVASGLYYTTDHGASWIQLTGTELQVPFYSLIELNGYYFGASASKIWRRHVSGGQFSIIASFPYLCRNLTIFNDDLYATTDNGLIRSINNNIYSDQILTFDTAFHHLERHGITPPIYGIRTIGSRLWLTTDERIYSVTSQRSLLLHTDVGGISPTIFINNNVRSVGVYYAQSGNIIVDTPLQSIDIVQIVTSYDIFTLPNGGWVDSQFDAPITLVLNGIEQPTSSTTAVSNTAISVAAATKQIVVPNFNARNSNFSDAFKYLTLLVQSQTSIQDDATLTPTMVITPDRVALLYQYIDLFKSNIYEELRSQVVLPPMGGTATTISGINFAFDAVNGTITVPAGIGKYASLAVNIQHAGLTGTGLLSHKQIEDGLEKVNSGLPFSLSCVQQSNVVRFGIQQQFTDPGGLSNSYQSIFHSACDLWYDKLKSTIDYSEQIDQSPAAILTDGSINYGSFSLEYPADVIYVPDRGEVWVCGAGGIMSIDISSFQCNKIVQTEFYFYNLHLSNGFVYTLAEDGLYKINIITLEITKNVDFDVLAGANSTLQFGDTTYLATPTGLYARQQFETMWRQIINVKNAFIRASNQLTFCIGTDVNSDTISDVYYSQQGIVWNRSNQFTNYIVAGITQRHDSVYYATNLGVLVEDVGHLFSNGGENIQPIDLNGDGLPDNLVINAIDSDNLSTFAAQSNGNWYQLSGNSVVNSGVSTLGTIHKVKVINGNYWFFAGNLIEIQHQSRLIHLSTGKILT